jgi:hypothetical protein
LIRDSVFIVVEYLFQRTKNEKNRFTRIGDESMYARCPVCSSQVIVKPGGICPHCKNKIADYRAHGTQGKIAKAKIPVRVVCAMVLYAAAIFLFMSLVIQFDFDILSFLLIAVSCFALAGIVSLVLRLRWSRKYNIVLQLVIVLFAITVTTVLVVGGILAGAGFVAVLLGFGLEAWVIIGFFSDRKVFDYLRKDSK